MSQAGDLHFEGLKNLTVKITAGDATHDDAHEMVSKCIDVGKSPFFLNWSHACQNRTLELDFKIWNDMNLLVFISSGEMK